MFSRDSQSRVLWFPCILDSDIVDCCETFNELLYVDA